MPHSERIPVRQTGRRPTRGAARRPRLRWARTIHVNTAHPKTITATTAGHSTGRSDGDVLVVDNSTCVSRGVEFVEDQLRDLL